ncbi:MAG: hypothetical protein ACFFAU_01105 [Candidatus Hodarchaeota archaeon]
MKILIFEGIDRTGKTTLRRNLLDKHPDVMTVDRLFLSQLVYNEYYKRNLETEILNLTEKYIEDIIVVYTFCDYETYLDRCSRFGHPILSREDYRKQQTLFNLYLKKGKFKRILKINTGTNNQEQCLDLLLKYIGVK